MINWETTEEDCALISKITDRALNARPDLIGKMDVVMSITAAHANGCPLDLQKFLDFDELDFWHDVFGISNHVDRHTAELQDCFLPRCARPWTDAHLYYFDEDSLGETVPSPGWYFGDEHEQVNGPYETKELARADLVIHAACVCDANEEEEDSALHA